MLSPDFLRTDKRQNITLFEDRHSELNKEIEIEIHLLMHSKRQQDLYENQARVLGYSCVRSQFSE